MLSMNSLNFNDSWLVPRDSLENNEFMENIGQANVFHEFRPMFSMNLWFSTESPGISPNLEKIMENIRLANVFHEFPRKNNGKHWPGQCVS